ncbi:MAG: hypothetical protein QOG96_2150 [Pseudonocardiales bacterium]|nr:hypothetical protein [Pseudonocardiales bacterium]
MAAAVTRECITLHGGAGYAIETGMEGLHRDAVGGLIIECTTDMHHSTVSYLLGFRTPQSVPSDLITTR